MAIYTQEEIDSVKAAMLALATGTRTVSLRFGERETAYQQADLETLAALLASMTASVASGDGAYHAYRVAAFDKGV